MASAPLRVAGVADVVSDNVPRSPSGRELHSSEMKSDMTPVEREAQHAEQEESGLLGFRVVQNDGEVSSLVTLIDVKNIYTKQLPKMGAEYICRLVLNRQHRSLICEYSGKVVGAITYRPHTSSHEGLTQIFAEIAFCCVSASHQVQGYGTRLMNQLKEHAKVEGIAYFLTYADDHAVNYFRKQGFQKQVTMSRERWKGYIKDYNGATMMECRIDRSVDYLSTRRAAAKQRELILQKTLTLSNAHVVRSGLPVAPAAAAGGGASGGGGAAEGPPDLRAAVPGLSETPWQQQEHTYELRGEAQTLQHCLEAVFAAVAADDNARPFQQPVSKVDAPDYYDVISDPMDLSTIRARLQGRRHYKSVPMLLADITRMCENCKLYNGLDNMYAAHAEKLETFAKARCAEIKVTSTTKQPVAGVKRQRA